MPSAQVIQFPSSQKPPSLQVVKSAAEIGEEALVITSQTQTDVCFARDDLREMIKLYPDNHAAIANRIYALRENFDDAQTALTKLLQQMGRT
ncbi:hypothetical protein [Pseudovibrio sp. Tun.PSC04-5.I4]|uniref:hypothetical protein n=1 Tax=Pseudovibrio sp. Tun.PSC04-5.I4 TaxID=1798213 RepID=UPI00087F9B7D|nr:hypothetical protein [Pseudovibrio sp. Tun.PSC04-5.I4]SDQ27570.1 hypothetical protein SAMN04515695_0680 [Pseudovibrio sp. Tun.PSC04-5.I4]